MTSLLATNGRPKIKGICIFCGELDYLTGEHLFAEWVGKSIPNVQSGLMTTGLVTKLGQEFKTFDLSERGGYANARMNVLCEKCNSGWGSILQQQTSLILKPIIAKKRWSIANSECSCIASWVTSFVMVRQFLHPTLVSLDAAQRKIFCDTKKPLESLSLWVAYFDGTKEQLSISYTGLRTSSQATKPNMFLLRFTMGNFVFFAYGTGSNVDLGDRKDSISILRSRLLELGLVPVWPLISCPPASSPLVLNDARLKELVPLVKRSMLYPLEPLYVAKNEILLDQIRANVNTVSSIKYKARLINQVGLSILLHNAYLSSLK